MEYSLLIFNLDRCVKPFIAHYMLNRKKSFVSDFGYFWKMIHTMLSIKNSKLPVRLG